MSKEINITIHNDGKLNGMIEIVSNDYGFVHSDYGNGPHGTQGKWVGGSPEYIELQKLCSQMIEVVKKINELH